jgi:hypothetical protein
LGTEPYDSTWRHQPQDAGQPPELPPHQQGQSVPHPQYGPVPVPPHWQAPPPHPGYGYAAPAPYVYALGAPFTKPNSTNGLATAGFVTGLCGLVLCWVPVLGVILAAVGVVLSAVGLGQLKKSGGATGLAVAGLALGTLGVLAFFGLIILVAAC